MWNRPNWYPKLKRPSIALPQTPNVTSPMWGMPGWANWIWFLVWNVGWTDSSKILQPSFPTQRHYNFPTITVLVHVSALHHPGSCCTCTCINEKQLNLQKSFWVAALNLWLLLVLMYPIFECWATSCIHWWAIAICEPPVSDCSVHQRSLDSLHFKALKAEI